LRPDGPYLDPLLTVGLCAHHHWLLHRYERAAGLHQFDDPSQARPLRTAFFLDAVADAERPFVMTPAFASAFAVMLREVTSCPT